MRPETARPVLELDPYQLLSIASVPVCDAIRVGRTDLLDSGLQALAIRENRNTTPSSFSGAYCRGAFLSGSGLVNRSIREECTNYQSRLE
jgi:hypothetical protein